MVPHIPFFNHQVRNDSAEANFGVYSQLASPLIGDIMIQSANVWQVASGRCLNF